MAYSATPVVAVGPSGPGALAGFESRCTCGLVMRSSLRTIIDADVREHAAWHLRQPARRPAR